MRRTAKMLLMAGVALALCVGTAGAKSGKTGKVSWMGVHTQTVDRELAEGLELSVSYGAVIKDVIADSPAEEAGIRENDVIVAIDGSKITDSDELIEHILDRDPGDKVVVRLMRDDREEEIPVILGSRKASRKKLIDFYTPDHDNYFYSYQSKSGAYIGVSLMDLSEQLGDYFGVNDDEGVLITSVEEDSPAEKAGLKAGDVILSVEGKETEDAGDVQELVRDREAGEEIKVAVMRDKKKVEFTVAVDEREDDGRPYVIDIPDLPDIDFHVPRVARFYKGATDDDVWSFDRDDLDDNLKELREELKKIKEELRELKESKP